VANRQLWKLLSIGVVLASAFLVGSQSPAGASGAGTCVGETTTIVVPRLVAGSSGQIAGMVQLAESMPAGVYAVQVGLSDDSHDSGDDDVSIVSLGRRSFASTFTTVEIVLTPSLSYDHDDDGPDDDGPDDDGPDDGPDDDGHEVGVTCVGLTRVDDLPNPAIAVSVYDDCTIPGLRAEITNLGGIDVAPESGGTVQFGDITKSWWLGVGQSKTVYATLADGSYPVSLTIGDEIVYTTSATVACAPTPDPSTPDPGTPDPGAPGSGTPDPGSPSPGTPDSGTPDPGTPGSGTPDPGTPGSGTPDPGSPDAGTPDPGSPDPGGPVADPPRTPVTIPTLSAQLDCATSTLSVVAGNDGDRPGAATIALVRTDRVVPVALEPHGVVHVDFELELDREGQRSEVVMVTSDDVVLSSTVFVDCLTPANAVVDLSVECQAGVIQIHLVNDGGEPLELSVFEEQQALLGEVTLPGGSGADFVAAITATEIPIRIVDGDGNDVLRQIVSHDCRSSEIAAELALACPSGELQLRLVNPGDEAGQVSVSAPDSAAARIELDPGAEITLVRSIDVGAPVDVVVLGSYGESVFEQTVQPWTCGGTSDSVDPACLPELRGAAGWITSDSADARDCEGIIVRMVVDCVARDVALDIDNQTPLPADLELLVGNHESGSRVVDGWDSLHWVVAGAADRSITLNEVRTDTVRLAADPGCPSPPNRAAGLSALLVVSMSLLALVVSRFDPWARL